jgi:hypothetical protein
MSERFLRELLLALAIFATFFAGAWSHEGDIQSSCKKYGHSSLSTWRGRLICAPAKVPDQIGEQYDRP